MTLALVHGEGGGRGERVYALSVVGKLSLELLSCEEDTALHGAERKVHLLGYLVVFVAGNVHGEGDAVVVREGIDGVGDFRCAE